ncbi:MAG: hypothetical protein IPK03_14365 [Bacteroidetes bacterium]|nr:hypothetical protein [Bacteroidota bacterium]
MTFIVDAQEISPAVEMTKKMINMKEKEILSECTEFLVLSIVVLIQIAPNFIPQTIMEILME